MDYLMVAVLVNLSVPHSAQTGELMVLKRFADSYVSSGSDFFFEI